MSRQTEGVRHHLACGVSNALDYVPRAKRAISGARMKRYCARLGGTLGVFLLVAGIASGQPIKLGELNSYKTFPAFLEPYKKGMELAVEEINASGGLLGRPLELVVRDDTGNPGDAVRVAEELITREKVDLLMGTFSSAVGLAIADFARQRKVLFLASEPLTDKIVWENGNRFTFRLRPSTYMQTAMLVPLASQLHKRRWAIVYPDYEYGKSATAAFKQQMIARQAAGGSVTGYPWSAISTPEHRRFLDAYQAKYKDYPRQGSVVGYSVVMSAAAAIRKARSTDTAKLVAALEGLNVDTPFGKITYRALD